MILQLNPPIPLETPKGSALAWFVIDYGIEYNLQYVCAIDATGEIWTFENPQVRAAKNITMGRIPDKDVNMKEHMKGKMMDNKKVGGSTSKKGGVSHTGGINRVKNIGGIPKGQGGKMRGGEK